MWYVVAIVSEDSTEHFLTTYKTTYPHNQEAYSLTVSFALVLVCHIKIKNMYLQKHSKKQV